MALPSRPTSLGGTRRKNGRKREKWGESGLAPSSGDDEDGDGGGSVAEWLPSLLPSSPSLPSFEPIVGFGHRPTRKGRIRESWCALGRLVARPPRRGSRKLICAPPSLLPRSSSVLPLPSFPLPLSRLPLLLLFRHMASVFACRRRERESETFPIDVEGGTRKEGKGGEE